MNRQLTMLIVDDMEVERISFAEILKDEYQILEAENGKQAMEHLEQQKVHIVLQLLKIISMMLLLNTVMTLS